MRNVAVSIGLGVLAIVSYVSVSGCSDSSPPPKPSGEGGAPPPAQWRAAVGSHGTLVQTFDDRTWTSRVVSGVDLFGVACVGNLEGWAAGAGGLIAHTTDGGKSWSVERSGTTRTLRAIRFGDALHGAAAGDGGTLVVTENGGATWRSVDTKTQGALRGVAIAGSLVLAVGDGGAIVRSIDGGRTFATSAAPGAGDLRAVASDPGAHLVLASGADGAIFASADRGVSFAGEAQAGVGLDAIALRDDGALAIAAGEAGTVLVRDARGTWTHARIETSVNLHAALVEDGHAYVAGDNGALFEATSIENGFVSVASQTTATLWALEDL